MTVLLRFFFPVLLLLLVQAPALQASETVLLPADSPLFAVEILQEGESIEDPDNPGDSDSAIEATRDVTQEERGAVEQALAWWTQVLGPQAVNSQPAHIVLLDTDDENNAAAAPTGFHADGQAYLAAALEKDIWPDSELPLAIIYIGEADWNYKALTMLPQNKDSFHLSATIVHELAHALGMSASITSPDQDSDEQETTGPYTFDSDCISLWTKGLHDAFDNPAEPGMEIVVGQQGVEGTFVLKNEGSFSGAYFTGTHVQEVLSDAIAENDGLSFPEAGETEEFEGTVPGLPVNGMEDGPELSHIELQNGLLSHQNWRNWTTLMEAELAAMQDLGLTIDRKRFFGSSIYASGEKGDLREYENNNPYYARENGQWVAGKPSETPLGIGLHVYGSYNDVTQAADLLTIGEQAVAMRIEGVGNHITIPEGTRLQADGSGGSAILVSYGKGHEITLTGEATALGEDGIAARFDFGDNALGNNFEYRGSWMRGQETDEGYTDWALLSKIEGALVQNFNVAGSLKGETAAIYIADNAHVQTINILSGAEIEGDIISKWDPENDKIHDEYKNDQEIDLYTDLTFGQKLTVAGDLEKDENFSLAYTGNISGADSFRMQHKAGSLALSGTVSVFSLENSGTLSLLRPDAVQVTVATAFTNNEDAILETGFIADGSMAGIAASSADLSGSTWAVRPLPDFYATGQNIELSLPVTVKEEGVLSTDNLQVTLSETDSPTLIFSEDHTAGTGTPSLTVTADRAPNAYSQYAGTVTSRHVGTALDHLATHARGDMQHLIASLDWSAPDGSGVASGMKQLASTAYDISARAALSQHNEFNMLILRRMLATRLARDVYSQSATAADTVAADTRAVRDTDWQVWATPYGASSFQHAHDGTSSWKSMGIGLIVGADRHFDSGLDLGVHVALAARRTQTEDASNAQVDTKSAFAGLQAMFSPSSWEGFYLTAQGRLGVESGEMDREVHINGYNRQLESNWSGFAGSAMLGAGKDFLMQTETGFVAAGPLAFFEYAFLQRPAFSEDGDAAARLSLDQAFYDSLLMNLGAHAGWQTHFANGTRLGVDVLAAWRHELLDGDFSSTASFSGYGAYDFESETTLPGRDSMLIQAALSLATVSDFSARLEAGAELFKKGYTSGNLGLTLSWSF